MLALILALAVQTPAKPEPLVKRGEPVTLVVEDGPLRITAPARALSSGAMGELVRVVTQTNSRTLHGVVDAPGRVRVSF